MTQTPPSPTATQRSPLTLAFIVSLGGFLFGFDASVISGVVGFITTEFGIGNWELGLVVGAPTLGGAAAAFTMGPLSDAIGRKKTLILIATLYTLSAIFSALAPNYETLVAARFIGGLAFGSLMIAPIYIAEISPAKVRGRFVSINQLNIVLGFSAAYFANYALLQLSKSNVSWISSLRIDSETWRWMLGLELIPAGAYALLLFTIPESPRWLTLKQRTKEALSVFNSLGFSENERISASRIQADRPLSSRLKLLLSPKLRRILGIGLIVGVAQQITGINAVYFYAPSIFEESGVGTDAAFAQAIWIGLTNVAFTLLSMCFIDKLGRRPLMLIGLTGTLFSLSLTAYGFSGDTQNNTLVLIGILGFVASFAFSLGPVMWVVLSEIFPACVRGPSMAVIGLINAGVSFIVQLVFPWELSTLGPTGVFMLFAVFALISLILVSAFLPETRGKSLESIEEEFA